MTRVKIGNWAALLLGLSLSVFTGASFMHGVPSRDSLLTVRGIVTRCEVVTFSRANRLDLEIEGYGLPIRLHEPEGKIGSVQAVCRIGRRVTLLVEPHGETASLWEASDEKKRVLGYIEVRAWHKKNKIAAMVACLVFLVMSLIFGWRVARLHGYLTQRPPRAPNDTLGAFVFRHSAATVRRVLMLAGPCVAIGMSTIFFEAADGKMKDSFHVWGVLMIPAGIIIFLIGWKTRPAVYLFFQYGLSETHRKRVREWGYDEITSLRFLMSRPPDKITRWVSDLDVTMELTLDPKYALPSISITQELCVGDPTFSATIEVRNLIVSAMANRLEREIDEQAEAIWTEDLMLEVDGIRVRSGRERPLLPYEMIDRVDFREGLLRIWSDGSDRRPAVTLKLTVDNALVGVKFLESVLDCELIPAMDAHLKN